MSARLALAVPGDPRLSLAVDGDGSLSVNAELVYGALPGYEGPTEFTPSLSEQVARTAGTQLASDITIRPVTRGSATAPSAISGSSASLTAGDGSITLTEVVSFTPDVTPGYVADGTEAGSEISLTAQVQTRGASTIMPGTADQTIAGGTYLTGAQTVKGDPNLVGSSIVTGTVIFGVQGTVRVPAIEQDPQTHGLTIT